MRRQPGESLCLVDGCLLEVKFRSDERTIVGMFPPPTHVDPDLHHAQLDRVLSEQCDISFLTNMALLGLGILYSLLFVPVFVDFFSSAGILEINIRIMDQDAYININSMAPYKLDTRDPVHYTPEHPVSLYYNRFLGVTPEIVARRQAEYRSVYLFYPFYLV